jgi:uncharacterized membrane protein
MPLAPCLHLILLNHLIELLAEETHMESKAKLFGHPIHPMLIVFPLGLLTMAVIFDLIGLAVGQSYWSAMAFYLIAAGLIGGLIAGLAGLVDWMAIPSGTRAKAIGLWHGVGNVIVLALFFLSWMIRSEAPDNPGTFAILLGIVGMGLVLITGWLGGEMVDRLGVGVYDGAHLNAPNSLSGRPASDYATTTARPGRTSASSTPPPARHTD